MNWQPIETAPRDRPFLAWVVHCSWQNEICRGSADRPFMAVARVDNEECRDGKRECSPIPDYGGDLVMYVATLWAPITPPSI